jgi:hypothetical protein
MSVQLSIMQPQIQVNNRTHEEVLAQIEVIVNWASRVGSPIGYYAIWFGQLLGQIEAERNWHRFEDSEAIQNLSLLLANRYFDALNLYMESESDAPLCWQAAFVATHQSELTVFQHVVLGTNALVQYDLPVALATFFTNPSQHSVSQDLPTMLTLIEENLEKTQGRFAKQSRVFRMMDAFGRSHNHWLELMNIRGLSQPTLAMAEQLSAMRGAGYQGMMAAIDEGATNASREIMVAAQRVLRRWFSQVSRWENQPVAEIMSWLLMSKD